ncbi:MORC family CW-type zinc finger protein 4-like [Microtus oregoni]|uniref:MORC family CW-type zinc finger protein 4-like n=1 Tax=Microtus oregoni TaxID=111838 RepID=UPI001BB13CAE|nr:MORC family CW-type zinc finger protein 4-like [Microtus oregoni]
MLLYRGAPAGPGAQGGGLARVGSVPQAFGIRLSTMSPRYLQSNSSSHTRPFSATAELLDNAVDPDVSARTVFIDVEEVKNKPCLTFTDDGCGMTPHKLHRMLSFGFTDKVIKKSQCPIGVFGNGFKSGSMRLGKDTLVFTKNGVTLTVGLLSQTYLECIQAQAVIVPIVPFSQQSKKMVVTEDSLPSLEAILNYSIFNSEKDLLSQFDAIPGKKGTRVFIWNVRRNKDGKSELDFDTDQYDILVSDFDAEEKEIGGVPSKTPETEYSLRVSENSPSAVRSTISYNVKISYNRIEAQVCRDDTLLGYLFTVYAKAVREYSYFHLGMSQNKQVKITFGFSCKYHNQFGVMMYHNNRLIKAFEKVGCQLKPTCGEGVGVIGVIECNFLKPAYNKQDFEYTKEYRSTINALAQKLNAYWKEKTSQENFENLPASRPIPDQTWVQCDECLKWRKLPGKVDPSTLPARWFCYYNPHPKYSKYKLILSEEPVEKRRRFQNDMTPSPIDYSMSSPYRRGEATIADLGGEDSLEKSSSERSTPPYLLPEYPEANKSTGHNREAPALCLGSQDQDQESLLPEELEDQMPRLVAEESNQSSENREVNKGPFVAVVRIAKGLADSGAPIQLMPFNREEFVGRRKAAAEPWNLNPYSPVAPATATAGKGKGYQESGSRNMPKIKNQRELEELKRTTEKLERVLAERNLFQQKVEELEQEKNHWHSEFKRAQHELVTYSTQETEGLYWSKKHMGYRQAEFQILKAELERTKEEKQELKEKLKETETHLEVLQKAQVSYRNIEGDDLERALAKLTRLRIHVSYLLTSVLPHLELREIGYDSEQVDGILYTVLEANRILD